jgi:uncharacterized protein HemY
MAKNSENPEVNYHFGMILIKAGEKEQARQHLQKALSGKWDVASRRLAEEALRSI